MFLRNPLRVSIACGAAVLAMALVSGPASAQSIFFDWGSNETVNDSGRDIVSFDLKARKGELIVSFGDRRVYLIIEPGKALSYPIAVPREKSKWAGVTSVSMKKVSPSWTPTPEMMLENPRLPPWVPGGHPMNPLGTHALYLGSSSYRIHGTDAPWTIGTAASKGCVRMYNKDVQDLYPRVPVGTKVTVTYQTYKSSPLDSESSKGILASLDKGRKIKPEEDVAATAEQTTKKWRGDDSDGDAQVHKAAAKIEDDAEDAGAEKTASEDREPENSNEAAAESEKSPNGALIFKKRSSDKRAVETGSVSPAKEKSETGSKNASTEARDKPAAKERVANKEKPEAAPQKAATGEDASAVANRALAAAERAAAAAERAANAAERASAAAIKATAKPEGGDTSKTGEAPPLGSWPVVKSAEAGSAMAWPVVKQGKP